MRERPILFSAPMVRAILRGTKVQTRRAAIKTSQPRNVYLSDFDAEECKIEIENKHSGQRTWKACPYGRPGDRLWVRENGWERPERAPKMMREGADTWERYYYDADGHTDLEHDQFKEWGFKRRPSIHMPRWASRILLEVTAVRVERLQDISAQDAIAEGIARSGEGWERFHCDPDAPEGQAFTRNPALAYRGVWEQINGPDSWAANPWVWVIEFRRAQP